jgi:uncharacterized membrane protein YoaK (UPF0700 family)
MSGTRGRLDPDQSESDLSVVYGPYRIRDSLYLDMSTLDNAASPPIRRDETVRIALLLVFGGGYLDAYTWILHGVLANAQTANPIFLWVHGTAGEWEKAAHFIPPIVAFTVGIVSAAGLRHAAGDRAGAISALIEIVLLVVVGLVHNRLPNIAGTLGTSFVAAMQTAVFTKVEGVPYSSVMATGNLRQAIENAYAAVSDDRQPGTLRLSGIFAALCVAFGIGAAVGAYATERIPDLALVLPVAALLTVLLHREV